MKQFSAARQAGVPLLCVETFDPAASMATIAKVLNPKRDASEKSIPVLVWDIVSGLAGVNDAGQEVCKDIDAEPLNTGNPTECLSLLTKMSKKAHDSAVVFFLNAHLYMKEPPVIQAIWNLRNVMEPRFQMLVMLGHTFSLPEELKHDCVVISDPLPEDKELIAISKSVAEDSGIAAVRKSVEEKSDAIVDTLRGLSAFAAKQCVSMSVEKEGLNMQEMMRLKRSYIAQLPGVEIREDKIRFDDIAGYDNVKKLLMRKIKGKRPPRLVIWWDEFDRTIAANSSDTSGTTQDQVATLLSWLQDRLNEDRLSAAILVGIPGAGKSAIASAIHNEAQCECIRWDMGGMKDSLVGSSEKRIRNVLKVVDAMSGGHILLIATCNSLNGVPAPVISRFALGTYYFALPTKEEVEALWKLKRKKYGISKDQPNPSDAPLVGREIQQCCFVADDLQIPLAEAIKYITPYYSTNASEIEALNKQAHKRWLSASKEGLFTIPQDEERAVGRRINV
jgi:hypothetical protein